MISYPNLIGLILTTAVSYLACVIEKTHKNTSIDYCFEKMEAKSTTFYPKLTNMSPSIESTEGPSEPKYDINTNQNISSRRS